MPRGRQQPVDLQRRHRSPTTSPSRRRHPSYQQQAITHLNNTHRAPVCWPSPATTSPPTAGVTPSTHRSPRTSPGTSSPASSRSWAPSPRPTPSTRSTTPFRRHVNINALAPMARLMSAGDLMVEYDQRYEHYGVPQPQLLALQLLQTPPASATRSRSARHGRTSRRLHAERTGSRCPGQRSAGPALSSPTP